MGDVMSDNIMYTILGIGFLLFYGGVFYLHVEETKAKEYGENTHYFERDCPRYNGVMK